MAVLPRTAQWVIGGDAKGTHEIGRNKKYNTVETHTTILLPEQRRWVACAVGGKKDNKGNEERNDKKNDKERNAAQSSVSFSSEKELEDPWPLISYLSLRDVTGSFF